jgi:hypothetical protein
MKDQKMNLLLSCDGQLGPEKSGPQCEKGVKKIPKSELTSKLTREGETFKVSFAESFEGEWDSEIVVQPILYTGSGDQCNAAMEQFAAQKVNMKGIELKDLHAPKELKPGVLNCFYWVFQTVYPNVQPSSNGPLSMFELLVRKVTVDLRSVDQKGLAE